MSAPSTPDSVHTKNFNGVFVMNKDLSDPVDDVLQLQEVGWILRKVIKMSAITITVKQTTNGEGATVIGISQTTTGSTNDEERTLDWQWREKKDQIFGNVRGRSRFVKLDDVQDPHLTKDLDQKSLEAAGNEVIHSVTESVGLSGDQWVAEQVWAFEVIDGAKRHVRRIVVSRGDETHKIKSVYDWKAQ